MNRELKELVKMYNRIFLTIAIMVICFVIIIPCLISKSSTYLIILAAAMLIVAFYFYIVILSGLILAYLGSNEGKSISFDELKVFMGSARFLFPLVYRKLNKYKKILKSNSNSLMFRT